jgi:hypothetical protein
MFYTLCLTANLTYPYKHSNCKRSKLEEGDNDDIRSNTSCIYEECPIKSTAGVIFAISELHYNANYTLPF